MQHLEDNKNQKTSQPQLSATPFDFLEDASIHPGHPAPLCGGLGGLDGVFCVPAAPLGVHARITCTPELALQGIDTLHVSYHADFPPDQLTRLQQAKLDLQSTDQESTIFRFGETNCFAWSLYRTGNKRFQYRLRSGDVTLLVSSRPLTNPMPTMQLQVGSISCHNGLDKLLAAFRRWCHHHGIELLSEKVSRLDLCADLALPIDSLDLPDQTRHISRVEKVDCHYSSRRFTGITAGKGKISLRIYDKLKEMTDKQADHKWRFFHLLWGQTEQETIDPETGKIVMALQDRPHITRVEFQLRREAIKEFFPESSDVATVQTGLAALWSYLTKSWFRQSAQPVDRENRHQDKATLSSFWLLVQQAFQSQTVEQADRVKSQKTINIEALKAQVTGCLVSICAAAGIRHDDLRSLVQYCKNIVNEKIFEQAYSPGFATKYYNRACHSAVTF